MIISSRLSKILQIMLQRDVFTTVDELANELQISKRTIFRELSDIEYYLTSYHLTWTSKAKKGIMIEGDIANKQQLLQDLNIKKVDYVNKEERRNLLIFEILREKDVQKLYYYANQFQVSESTISNDLDEIESWFANYQLHIIRTPGLGIHLEGKESDYRRALTQIISKSIQENNNYERINSQDALNLLEKVFLDDQDGIMKLLNQTILKRVLMVFDVHHHELNLDRYAQSSYIGLIIHLTIAIERILQQERMEENFAILNMMKDTPSYEQAQVMVKFLETEFDVVMPEVEIAFISMHIEGAKLSNVEEGLESVLEDEKIFHYVDEMITYFDQQFHYHLSLDEELRRGLCVHLKPALVRLTYRMHIFNPLLEQIKKDYEQIFMMSKQACQCLVKDLPSLIPEDEIAYIAMHFGAAIERAEKNAYAMRKVHVGIVCSSGIGVSALLLARIKKIVDHNVVLETLSMDEAIKQSSYAEFYLSTFTFDAPKKLLVVNPLLDQEDVKKIKDEIEEVRRMPVVHIKEERNLPLQASGIVDDIFLLLEQIGLLYCDTAIDKDALLHYIAKLFGHDAASEAIIYESLLEREKVCSSMYPQLHFAIFHASLPCIETCTCKIIRTHDACFHGELKDLNFVVAMFMPAQSTHLQKQMMSCISRRIMEDDAFYELLKKGDEQAIQFAVETCMKDFLFETLKESRGK